MEAMCFWKELFSMEMWWRYLSLFVEELEELEELEEGFTRRRLASWFESAMPKVKEEEEEVLWTFSSYVYLLMSPSSRPRLEFIGG